MNEKLQEAIRETLALIGYVDPVKGCGVRVLSIDGGGTKYEAPHLINMLYSFFPLKLENM